MKLRRQLHSLAISCLFVLHTAWAGPLHDAAQHGDLYGVKVQVEKFPDQIDAADADGWTALHHAAKHGHVAVAQNLIFQGKDPAVERKFLFKP